MPVSCRCSACFLSGAEPVPWPDGMCSDASASPVVAITAVPPLELGSCDGMSRQLGKARETSAMNRDMALAFEIRSGTVFLMCHDTSAVLYVLACGIEKPNGFELSPLELMA